MPGRPRHDESAVRRRRRNPYGKTRTRNACLSLASSLNRDHSERTWLMPRNILLHGAGFINKGAEAMLLAVRTELCRRLPDAVCHMRVLRRDVELARGAGVEPIIVRPGKIGSAVRLASATVGDPRLALAALRSPKRAALLPSVRNVDAMVDISGFSLSDAWGVGNARNHLSLVSYLASRGRPSVYLPQAWGPFTDRSVARLTVALCRKVRIAYVRDQESRRYLESLAGMPRERIGFAYDVAFRFVGDPPTRGRDLLREVGVEVADGPIVGIVPNMRVYERSPGDAAGNGYVQLLASAARCCSREFGAKVVAIPHEIGPTPSRDDRYLCSLLQEVCGDSVSVAAMTRQYSAGEVKSVIGHLGLLIGSRYHSLVAALSQRVPAVSLGWSHKYDELMRAAGLGDYACEARAVEPESFMGLLRRAWLRREELQEALRSTVPVMEKSADEALTHAAEILREGGT